MFERVNVMKMLAWYNTDPAAAAAAAGGGGGAPGAAAVPADNGAPATESASAEARRIIASGGSLADIGVPAHARQPRNSDGQFDGAPAPAAPADGQPNADANAPPAEVVDPAAAAVDPNAEQPDTTTTEGEGDQGDTPRSGIELPGFAEGEEPIVLEIEDPVAQARIEQLQQRSAQLEEYVQRETNFTQQVEQLEEIRDMVEVDPAGYLLDMIPSDPAVVTHLTRFLLTQPAIWAALKDEVLNFDNPEKLALAAATARAERSDMREELRTASVERKQVSENYTAIQNVIGKMAPPEMAEPQKKQFFVDTLRDLQHHADRHKLRTIPPGDVPVILASRLRAYNIDPVAAAARATATAAAPGARKVVAKTAVASPAAAAGAQKTGAEFVQGAEARQRFQRIPAGGAGTPSNMLVPPEGQSIEERIAWHRGLLRKGQSAMPG